jgi:hypothetical protein
MHLVVQSPQWFTSLLGSVQALSQITSVASAHLHWPAWHDWPDVHVVPQAPQFRALTFKSTQVAPHAVLPLGQPHFPAEQACPPAHLVSHVPQVPAVVCKSTQASPQRVRPAGQACVLGIQLVTAQISPTAQVLSQLPQCCGEFRFEHSLPHSCSPVAHAHFPSKHAAPPEHAVVHEPQCAESDIGSKHWPPQNSTLSGQPHTPPKQGTPISHTLPQAPQLPASVAVLAQVAPHF